MVLATRGRKSRIRRLADSQELDTGILLVIMFNCVIMAFPPNKLKNATSPTDFFCLADFILNFIFFCEFAIKFYAYGLAYFKDTWNPLDTSRSHEERNEVRQEGSLCEGAARRARM